MLIDTHAHLNFPDFQSDIDKVIEKSVKEGVKKIICASSNIDDSKKSVKMAKRFSNTIFASIGIHPQKTDPENFDSIEEQVKQLTELVNPSGVCAIGECGLDFSPPPPNEQERSRENQEKLFRLQIELAQKFSLPLIIHSRKALDATLEILKGYQNLTGVFHCYSGGKSDIKKVLDLGFCFGLDGNLTYDLGLQNVAKEIPLEKIVLETDSPFLTPQPLRGQRNEPANIKIIAEFLADLKDIAFNEVEKVTTENAKKLFNLN